MSETVYVVVLLVLWVLALARLTRLVNADQITDPLRIAVARRWGENGYASYFLACPWCVSIWLGFATAPFVLWLSDLRWWTLPLVALAGSEVTGFLAQADRTEVVELVVSEDD